jgi:hypothetical protein
MLAQTGGDSGLRRKIAEPERPSSAESYLIFILADMNEDRRKPVKTARRSIVEWTDLATVKSHQV